MNGSPFMPCGPVGQPEAGDGDFLVARPSAKTGRTLIIVARDQPDLWHALAGQFADSATVQVLPDRRRWVRRQRVQRDDPDRRGSDRRRLPGIEQDVRRRSFVIIRQQDDTETLGG